MATHIQSNTTVAGAGWALAAVFCFSVNDVLIKLMSESYALHQVILTRSILGTLILLAVFVPLTGGSGQLATRRLGLHLVRGLCVVFSNVCFFAALAAMPLAEAVAVFFVSPLLVSVFSVVFLGEYVGPRRWAAIGVGFVGVMIVLRPGSAAFQAAALLPLAAAVGYAALHTLTRRLGATESATAMAFYIQVMFLFTSGAVGLAVGHGGYDAGAHPSLSFLLRAWVWPEPADFAMMCVVGLTSISGGFAISQAYRLSEAALVAPFEYAAMPLAVFFGFAVFGEWPDRWAWVGIALILAAGLVLIWRETLARRAAASRPPDAR